MRIATRSTLLMVIIALLGISFIPACQETATEEDDASAGRKVKLLLHKIGGLEVEIAGSGFTEPMAVRASNSVATRRIIKCSSTC